MCGVKEYGRVEQAHHIARKEGSQSVPTVCVEYVGISKNLLECSSSLKVPVSQSLQECFLCALNPHLHVCTLAQLIMCVIRGSVAKFS